MGALKGAQKAFNSTVVGSNRGLAWRSGDNRASSRVRVVRELLG
jgi:hypothetical protein